MPRYASKTASRERDDMVVLVGQAVVVGRAFRRVLENEFSFLSF
jgi:hypothetical protein